MASSAPVLSTNNNNNSLVAVQRLLCLLWNLFPFHLRDSSVGIATRYGLDGPGDRIPVGASFSAPVQNGPGAYPASRTMGTGSFSWVKRPGRGVDHSPPFKFRGHERVGLYLYSSSGLQWPVTGRIFPFHLPTSPRRYFFFKTALLI